MQKKQVAVIDIGSSKVTAVIGERGVNKTFVIKAKYSFEYDGFEAGVFFDVKRLKQILYSAINCFNKGASNKIDTVYVGVPGEFTKIYVRDAQLTFSKKRKIVEEDMNALFDGAYTSPLSNYTLITRSAIVYELDDFRRMANPIGAVSEILCGRLSFILCSNYFIEVVKNTILEIGVNNVECVSSALAETLYLVNPEIRDKIVIYLNVGYISTTLSIVQGDGLLYQSSFPFGGGYLTAALVERFTLPFSVAEKLKRKINLCTASSEEEMIEADDGETYSLEEIILTIKTSLDSLCDNINQAFEKSGYAIPEHLSFLVTGGGITYVRGAKEYVSQRLNRQIEVVAPKVPLMDKPSNSTLLSLLDLALEQ